MARFGVGVLLLLATSCAAARATPASSAASTACTFGDLRICTALCERGSAESCNAAGAHYELGSGVTRDVDAAARYYARGCSAGAAAACENGERVRAAKLVTPVVASPVAPPAPTPIPTPTPTPKATEPGLTSDAQSYGTFASTGGFVGTWSTTASRCSSGESQSASETLSWAQFDEPQRRSDYSLMLQAASGKVFGVVVQRARPFRSVDFTQEQCSRFDVGLRSHADGSLSADVELDCTATDGGRVTASIHCAACGSM